MEGDLLEQDIHDILFEAGYDIEEIDQTILQMKNASSDVMNFFDQEHLSLPSESLQDPDVMSVLGENPDHTLSDELLGENINSESDETECENPTDVLHKIRIKNVNRIVIGSLNINSLPAKFDQLKEVIGKNLDILTIQETKLDSSFTPQQFIIEGYSEPYRLDRDRDGGGVLIYVREDIPSKLLKKHNFTQYVEGMFVEINLRKTKLLLFGGYRSEHLQYGLSKTDFLEQVRFGLDKYSSYEKVLLAGDFNMDSEEEILEEFLFEQDLKNLVKEPTCFKSVDNPSCIDVFLTNTPHSFQHTTTVETGLSDFHKMAISVLKTTYPKAQPKIIYYRDYKHFDLPKFRAELRDELKKSEDHNYFHFEVTFLFKSFGKIRSHETKSFEGKRQTIHDPSFTKSYHEEIRVKK